VSGATPLDAAGCEVSGQTVTCDPATGSVVLHVDVAVRTIDTTLVVTVDPLDGYLDPIANNSAQSTLRAQALPNVDIAETATFLACGDINCTMQVSITGAPDGAELTIMFEPNGAPVTFDDTGTASTTLVANGTDPLVRSFSVKVPRGQRDSTWIDVTAAGYTDTNLSNNIHVKVTIPPV
jgi:hypothetical protein